MIEKSQVAQHRTISGRHVAIGLAAFFVTIFAVNGFFLYHAVRTHSGVETPDAYQRGLAYNDRIEAGRQQNKRGWKSAISVDGSTLQVMLKNQSGQPVSGLKVTASLGRPATDHDDRKTVMTELAVGGTYRADVGTLHPGRWIVTLQATRSHERQRQIVYRTQRRLWLKP